MNKSNILAAFIAASMLTSAAHADFFSYSGSSGNWDNTTDTGWLNVDDGNSFGVLPGAGDLALFNNNKTVTVDTDVTAPGAPDIRIGNTNEPAHTSTLNVNTGGVLAGGLIQVSTNAANAVLNVNGGSLTSTGGMSLSAAGQFNLTSGSYTQNVVSSAAQTVLNGAGLINISGGTFSILNSGSPSAGLVVGTDITISGGTFDMSLGQFLPQNNMTLTVEGSAATVQTNRLNAASAARAATLAWNFDSTGVSTIVNTAFASLEFASLRIDGTNYTGGAGTFDLFTSTSLIGTSSDIIVTGFGTEGVDWTLVQNSTTNNVEFTVIPEPGSFALVAGMLGLCAIMLRRRR